LPNRKEELGFDASDYAAWLHKKGRQSNVTNYFEFVTEHLEKMPPEKKNALAKKLEKAW
jgi:hypothetical protein